MMATEFALKKIPVRVCGVAPGVYVSEMTASRLPEGSGAKEVNELGHAIVSVPTERPGRSVIDCTATVVLMLTFCAADLRLRVQ